MVDEATAADVEEELLPKVAAEDGDEGSIIILLVDVDVRTGGGGGGTRTIDSL